MGKVIKVDERIEFISSSHDHYLLAAIASARDDREAVIRTLKDMTDVGTSITAAYYLLAKSYEAIGDQDLALSNYLKAEILDRRDITCRYKSRIDDGIDPEYRYTSRTFLLESTTDLQI